MTRFAWGPNAVIGIEKLVLPPSYFGLGETPDDGLPTAALFQIEELMGQRIERKLGTPNQQAWGWSPDRMMCYPDIWMTPEEVVARNERSRTNP